ncbi:juvenile hormone esterase-like [Hylaeus volcanicus]|uniref:juvenile hormone esterase-like n=1 Tax=Hylaeus volcanicus TaxID=313075 RepID=UPI0023B86DB9|nr:juvenile hormone esterase-like [Hylaeus volcanicus]
MTTVAAILCCLVGVLTTEASPSQRQLLVTAPIGPVKGSILTSRLGKDIYSFRGVRYAEPPTGRQRFQPPIPAEDWEDVFDASEEGPECPQPRSTTMSEDCLRLNVYTTKLPSEGSNVSRPVIVFLHPGGFYSFSGKSSLFGPQYLMDQDIVLVTINYRLGALGKWRLWNA